MKPAIAALILLTACDTGSAPEETVDTSVHDCVPYTPTTETVVETGTWNDIDAEITHTYTTPSDPGGGLLTMRVSAPGAGPWLDADVDQEGSTALISDGAETDKDVYGMVEVAPDQTVTAVISPWFSPDEYPADYTVTFDFAGAMDCYEPNDTIDEARLVPTDTPLEAMALAHRTTNHTVYTDFDDWYTVTTTQPGATLTLVPPMDLRMSVTVLDDTRSTVADDWGSEFGQILSLTIPEAGTYSLQVEVLASETLNRVTDPDEALPDHFVTPYTFEIVEP